MRQLWAAMAGCYGYLWTSAYGDDSSNETGLLWAHGLAGLGPAQVKRGIEEVLRSNKPHPPTLPHFRALCLMGGQEIREPTKEEIAALAEQNERDDRAYFERMNDDWLDAGHSTQPPFAVDACIYTRSRYLSDAEKTLRRKP